MSESLPIPFREASAPQGTPPLLLFFEEVAIKDEKASEDGPPIFDRCSRVRIVVAGSNGDGPIYEMERFRHDGTVKKGDGFARFREPYEGWKKGQAFSETGTPLELWPLMDVAMVAQLKACNVYTVQQLAELSDGQMDSVFRRGGREWRAKAAAFIGDAKTAAGDAKLNALLAKRDEEIAELQGQVKQLLQRQNGVGFDKPKKGKRSTGEPDDIVLTMPEDADDARL